MKVEDSMTEKKNEMRGGRSRRRFNTESTEEEHRGHRERKRAEGRRAAGGENWWSGLLRESESFAFALKS
jgi:hypothetical protein